MTPTITLATVADVLNTDAMETYRAAPALTLLEAITQAIQAFSLQAEAECGRWFKRTTWTEVLDVECAQRLVSLRAYPVASVTTVKVAADSDFASATALDATDYALTQSGRTGQLMLRSSLSLFAGTQTLQVVYVGGLAEHVHQIPADLRQACIEQALLSLKRPDNIDIAGKAQSGGSVTYFRNAPLTTAAQAAIDRYRRHW
jgi:uncharacterized phiE125 gp8 family phage protein